MLHLYNVHNQSIGEYVRPVQCLKHMKYLLKEVFRFSAKIKRVKTKTASKLAFLICEWDSTKTKSVPGDC